MRSILGCGCLAAVLALQGCLSAGVSLHLHADGSGEAVLTTRYLAAGMSAFDAMFPEVRQAPARLEEVLPEPGAGAIEREFGPRAHLVSSTLARDAQGGTRTTTISLQDIRDAHLALPSPLAMPTGRVFDMSAAVDTPTLTFAMRRHDNGDRLLIVNMPSPRVRPPSADSPITTFETGSTQELLLKKAIKGLAYRMSIRARRADPADQRARPGWRQCGHRQP